MINIDIGNDPCIDYGHQVTSIWSGIQFASRVAKEAHAISSTRSAQIQQLNNSVLSSCKDCASLRNGVKLFSETTRENANLIRHILEQI